MIVEVTAVPFSIKNAGGGERFPTEFYKELKKYEETMFCYSSKEGEFIDDSSMLIPGNFYKFKNIITEVNPIPTFDTIKTIKNFLNYYENEIEFLHIHNLRTAMSTIWLLLLLKKKPKNLRIILTDHNARFFPFPKLSIRPVDYYAPVSTISDKILQELNKKPSFILPTFVSSTFQGKSLQLDFIQRDIDLLFLGRIVPWKGVDKVIQIGEKLIRKRDGGVKIVIAGRVSDQNYLNQLKRLVLTKHLEEKIEFDLDPTDDAIASLYARAKVHILFSVTKDIFGQIHHYPELNPATIAEASICGTPSIVSSAPGLKEQIVDGHDGYIIPEDDLELATTRILSLINDRDGWGLMSQNAYKNAVNTRTLVSIVRKFRSNLDKIRNGEL